VERRWWSCVTDMGITGQMLVLIHLLSVQDSEFGGNVATFLKALPDQNIVASQNVTGLSLPVAYLDDYQPGVAKVYSRFAEILVEPTFLESFFTLLPWNCATDLKHVPRRLFLVLGYIRTGRDAYVIRLLSLRNLPQHNPRWGDEAKQLFHGFMNQVLHEVRFLRAPWFYCHFSIPRQQKKRHTPISVQNTKL